MSRRLPRAVRSLVVCVALLVSGCTGASTGASHRASPVPELTLAPGAARPGPTLPGDWLTYHHDPQRSGDVPGVPAPGVPVAAPASAGLRQAWRAALDGAVYGQPLIVRGTVVAATEHDSVYGLDPATGRVRWHTSLGTPEPLSALPCGGIDPLGITGTPVYEPTTGLVFAVAELNGGRHVLVGLDPATGAVRVRREAEPPRGDRLAHQQRGALAAVDGRVLVTYGGLEGDCGNYVGSVVSVPATGAGPLVQYSVPTSRQGGIWAPGGPVVTPDGRVLVSVGNGAATHGAWDGSDSVVALSPGRLTVTGAFAPTTWAQDNAEDLDLGSLTPALVGDDVLAVGKRGTGYTLGLDTRLRRSGVGGEQAQARLCGAFGSAAVRARTVFVPCPGELLRVDVGLDGVPRPGWHVALRAGGSPVLGGGAVWEPDYGAGTLLVIDQASGRVLARLATGALPHFASPVLSGDRLLIGTLAGVTAFTGA
ncbi:PQQ-binding-like beta-propeller repeat protein [Streptacidiphilus jiangxiensis]|uniref:PQQ-like domain-containing protein n=1 Tax=Streptacidiphilus jiangxiensis TaxID=235985 RepID=A0A1H7UUS8_STRJI|nr:PQQ-binding-like beta-propeller repeat protein [Streptacidiphilus jiangxiensis]SEM00712.1 PQQ-like domain-containing protein [Streptacidiphilus jiangxiensis]